MSYHIIYLLTFLISLILAYALFKVRRSDVGLMLTIMTLLTSFWLLMEGLSFVVDSTSMIVFLQRSKYFSIIFNPPILVITAYAFTWKLNPKKFKWLSLLFIVPVLSLVSISTNIIPYPFISNTGAHWDDNIVMFTYDRNIGFFIHVGYSYILMLINNVLLFYRFIKSPKAYKLQSLFVFTGTLLSLLLNVLFLSGYMSNIKIDSTPFSVLATLFFYYWGVYNLPRKSIVPHARNLVIENMSDLVIIVDNHNNIIDVNPTAYNLLTLGSSLFKDDLKNSIDFRGMSFETLMISLPINNYAELDITSMRHQLIDVELDNKTYHYQGNQENIYDSDSISIGSLYIFYDITDIQKNINELLDLNKSLNISDTIINDALEGIIITDSNNTIIRVNHSMEVISGYSSEELIGNNPNLLKSTRHDYNFFRHMWDKILEDGFWEGEIWDKRKNGEVYPKWMSITVIKDESGEITHFIGISSDISKIKKAEKDIHLMAYYDSLTGLPNRTLFNDRLEIALERCKRHNKKLALFYMDLGRFKLVNDTYGHGVGDELLIAISNRIKNHIRKTDTFCRLGGDEFTLIVEDLNDGEHASIVAQTIINEIEKGFTIQTHEISVSISIGITIYPDDDISIEGLIRKSDAAMYHAKDIGGSLYTFSSDELENHNKELYQLEIELKKAVDNHDFELYLQPQIGKIDDELYLSGAEALIRWRKEDGTMIPPFKFISIAERNGLINPIGIWVLEEVFRINEQLAIEDINIDMALNVSIKQFETDDFFNRLKEIIHEDISLSVEITESLFFNNLDMAIEKLELIKSLGVQIALDDFGTGFSSMSYLNRLPVDYLKIDKSFIDQIDENSNKNLAYMILSMAKTLELKTIAEGIEEEHQALCIFNEGCDIIQGYYYSKPLPVSEFIKFAKKFNNEH